LYFVDVRDIGKARPLDLPHNTLGAIFYLDAANFGEGRLGHFTAGYSPSPGRMLYFDPERKDTGLARFSEIFTNFKFEPDRRKLVDHHAFCCGQDSKDYLTTNLNLGGYK
jgi:hypothetical protein